MPGTVFHVLSMTTPDDPLYENKPSNWNSGHAITFNAVGSEISGAFGNGGGVTFGYDGTNVTASAPAAGGGLTNINVSAGTTSNNLSALTFADSNGITFGLNGSVITGTVATNYQSQGAYLTTAQPVGAYLTTARASNDAVGLNTALTANGVSWTVNSAGLSLNVPAFLTTAQPVGAYLTTARASNDGIGLNTAQSNVTWTVNSSGISLDANGYAGTGTSATNASITMNSNGLAISVAAPGGVTNSAYIPPSVYDQAITVNIANGSMSFEPMLLQAGLQFDNLMHQIVYSNATNSSGSLSLSFYAGVYTRNASTLSLVGSARSVFNITNSGTAGIYSSIGGIRALPMGWTTTLTAGDYYVGIGISSATAGADCSISHVVGSGQASNQSGVFGIASNASKGLPLGWGRFSIATGQAPNSVAFSDIQQTGSAHRRALVFWMQSNSF